MNIFFYILIFILGTSILYSNVDIAEDNFKLQMDKTAHFSTSFGLYYTFYTLYSDTLFIPIHDSLSLEQNAMLSAFLIGLTYEIYQSTSYSNSDGFSIHDLSYNSLGIFLANVSHKFLIWMKEIL